MTLFVYFYNSGPVRNAHLYMVWGHPLEHEDSTRIDNGGILGPVSSLTEESWCLTATGRQGILVRLGLKVCVCVLG